MAPKEPCAKYQYVLTSAGPKILPVADEESKDEEAPADYNSGGYLPIKVDDTFKDGRYRVLRKLGWGHFSTVWLVKDSHTTSYSALKVVKSAGRYAETARDEIKLLSRVAQTSLTHPGRNHIVSFLDSFTHAGPDASHICIVFEPLGENLLALIERHKKKGVPRALVKIIASQILLGLAYLHDQCDLVHTDIKPENILIAIPNIESYIDTELTLCPSPTSRRVGVPLPAKSRPGGVSIPAARTTRRQVQIFDSQPLASPGRAPLSGGNSACNSTSIGSMKRVPRLASSGAQSVKSTVPSAPTPLSKSNPAAGPSSPSSSTSSISSSSLLLTSTIVASTPATSVSHGSSTLSRMKPLDNPSTESTGMAVPVRMADMRSALASARNLSGKIDAGKANVVAIPGSSPERAADNPLLIPAPGKSKAVSPTASLRKQALSSSPLSSAVRIDPAARFVAGATSPAPAVVVSASIVISCAGANTNPLQTLDGGGHDLQSESIEAPKGNASTVTSLLTQTAPRDRSCCTTSPASSSHAPSRVHSTSPITNASTSPTTSITAALPSPPSPPPSPPPPPPISIKIADLGNATPSMKHYTDDIQTRQYRSPEAIVGRRDWDARVDVWSLACMVFELLTAEYLFDPHGQGELFTKDDDHMAQIIELMGDFRLEVKMGGKYSRELFDHTGALRYIRTLKPWPLKRVMTEKYLFSEEDADALCAFLEPMLMPDMRERKKASDMVDHDWLTVTEADGEVSEW